jgi:hypothetical protein
MMLFKGWLNNFFPNIISVKDAFMELESHPVVFERRIDESDKCLSQRLKAGVANKRILSVSDWMKRWK